MTIKEAWNIIAALDIELVEQYSARKCDQWHEAIETLQDFLRPMFVEPKTEHTARTQKPKQRRAPAVQFELKAYEQEKLVREAYDWCKQNLQMKPERGLIFWPDEIHIITASQRILDKVNAHFGTTFNMEHAWETRVQYLRQKEANP